MTEKLTFLLVELGYQGKVVQVAPPSFPDERIEHECLEEMRTTVGSWRDVQGHVISEGTTYENGKFALAVKDSNDDPEIVNNIHVVINAAGKTSSTPLVKAMMEKGYIGQHPDRNRGDLLLHSKHPRLAGYPGFFSRPLPDDDGDPISQMFYPLHLDNIVTPSGWLETYEFGCSIRDEASDSDSEGAEAASTGPSQAGTA